MIFEWFESRMSGMKEARLKARLKNMNSVFELHTSAKICIVVCQLVSSVVRTCLELRSEVTVTSDLAEMVPRHPY